MLLLKFDQIATSPYQD